MREFSRDSYRAVALRRVETAPPQQSLQEQLRAARESELRDAAREYEAELLTQFDGLPKWHTNEDGVVRHYYWNGETWVEFELDNPPLWVVENIDLETLEAPGV